jgi:long-chain acyl-CoA synthetase
MVRPFSDLVELSEVSCRTYRERPLFGTKRPGGWSWTSYGEFAELVHAFRGGLATLGIAPGDRVAIVSRNRLEWAVAAYATYGLGATFVPMYEAQRPDEWEFILDDCSAKAVIASTPKIADMVAAMKMRLPHLAHVVALEGRHDGVLSYEALLDQGRSAPVRALRPDPQSVAGFVYTSGTTGKPKGVMLTHANLTSNIASATTVFPVRPEDRTLSFLPWAHVYGQAVELHMIVSAGASTAFNTDLPKLLDELAEVRPTMLVAVPRIFNRLYANVNHQIAEKPRFVRALFHRGVEASKRKRRGETLSPLANVGLRLADRVLFARIREKLGGRLVYAISASASLSKEVAEFIDALGIDVYEGYGLTETSPVVSANYPGARKLGSVGKPIPGVTVEIDTSVSDEPGRGEIIVRGPNVMKAYYRREEETAKAIMPDGGFRTGDVGYLDEDGFLYITGRIKEQYKLENGKYVMPAPLEERLKLSPYFSNVMLYGDNRAYNAAIIVLAEGEIRAWAEREGRILGDDLTTDPNVRRLVRAEVQELCRDFRSYEVPRAFVLTREDFTIDNGLLTPTLKLKRRAVVERYRKEIDALFAAEAVGTATA